MSKIDPANLLNLNEYCLNILIWAELVLRNTSYEPAKLPAGNYWRQMI